MENNNAQGGVSKFVVGGVVVILAIGAYFFLSSPKEGDPAFEKNEAVMMKVETQTDTMMANDAKKGDSMMNESMSISLGALNNSGVKGEAVLTPKGGKTEVVVTLTGATPDAHPAHIHMGACPVPGAVKYPLSPIVGGKSVTMIDVSVDDMWKMLPLAINVHKSPTEAKVYLSCGDFKSAMMGGAMMSDTTKTEGAMMQAETMMKVGSYEAYAPEKIAKAATGDVVLFFRASWCPTCRGLDADIKANFQNIPADLTILDVDYDNSGDLKKKYGVTYQHTMVQVDQNGTMIKKWTGSPGLTAFLKEVK